MFAWFIMCLNEWKHVCKQSPFCFSFFCLVGFLFCLHFCLLSYKIIRCIVKSLIATPTQVLLKLEKCSLGTWVGAFEPVYQSHKWPEYVIVLYTYELMQCNNKSFIFQCNLNKLYLERETCVVFKELYFPQSLKSYELIWKQINTLNTWVQSNNEAE